MQAHPGEDAVPLPSLSAERRRGIAVRAASLDELIGALRASPGAPPDPLVSDAASLATWLNTCSPGDAEAFVRRLAWDGLDASVAAWLLTEEAAASLVAGTEPEWLAWLDRVLEQAPAVAAEIASGGAAETATLTADGLPYAELLVPMIRAAASAIDASAGDRWRVDVSATAREAWLRQLGRELAGITQVAIHERFDAFRTQAAALEADATVAAGSDDARAPDLYTFFVVSLLQDGLADLFESLPVLARHVATALDRHVEGVLTLLARLAADSVDLSAQFAAGATLLPVVGVEPALSDPHEGRRRVVGLTFASGLRLVYKPRDVRVERAFGALLRELAARGCRAVPPGLDVLARDGYGWEGFVEQQPVSSEEEARDWFRRAGGLLCVAWLLGGRDLHMENVVATREGPVLVDLEALFAPGETPVAAGAGVGESATPPGSCLETGFVSFVAGGPDTPLQDVGGLRGRGAGTSTLPRRVWRELGTSVITFAEESAFAVAERNAVLLDGVRQAPEAYAVEIADGFAEAYRHLMAAGNGWIAPGGAIDRFAGADVRVFTRDTNQYGLLLHVLSSPKYQQRGTRRSIAYDVLARGLVGAREKPAEWGVIQAERVALDALDVPRFTVAVDEATVKGSGRAAHERRGVRPGLPSAVERWRGMTEAGLGEQTAAIRGVLGELRQPRFEAPWPTRPATAAGAESSGAWRDCAIWIGHELLRRARRDGDALTWTGRGPERTGQARAGALHDGALGPVLLLAALAAEGAGHEFEEAARSAVRPVLAGCREAGAAMSMPIGGTIGVASLVYGLSLAGTLLDEEPLLSTAADVARAITAERIGADTQLDVVGGVAGAVLALLGAHEAQPAPEYLERAVACGDHLLAREHAAAPGGAWLTPQGYAYTGFAHGIAGAAAALARLAGATALDRFHAAASRAYRRLALARAGAASWPIAFRPGAAGDAHGLPSMVAWCHGAPGILLALMAAPDDLRDDVWREETAVALRACLAAPTHKTEHACCGNLSRAEALFTAGVRLASQEAHAGAVKTLGGVVRRAAALGHLRLTAVPYDYRVFSPAFFQGTAGAGYQLLRAASGGRLPSVLSLEGRRRRLAP